MSFHKTLYKYLVQEKFQPYDKRNIRNYKWNFTEFQNLQNFTKKTPPRFKVKDEVVNLAVDSSILTEFSIENKDILSEYFFLKLCH